MDPFAVEEHGKALDGAIVGVDDDLDERRKCGIGFIAGSTEFNHHTRSRIRCNQLQV